MARIRVNVVAWHSIMLFVVEMIPSQVIHLKTSTLHIA